MKSIFSIFVVLIILSSCTSSTSDMNLSGNVEGLRKLQGQKPLIVISGPTELNLDLESLRDQFKHYKANEKASPRVQAHFLLYHHKQETQFVHECDKTKGVFFLPFSPGSKQWH